MKSRFFKAFWAFGVILLLCPLLCGGKFESAPKEPALTTQDKRKALTDLRKAIDENYSYRDQHKVNWDNLFKAFSPRLLRAKTTQEFAQQLANMLVKSKDLHVRVSVNGSICVPTIKSKDDHNYNKVDRNFNMETLAKVVPNYQKKNPRVSTGRYPDSNIGYILIASWSANDEQEIDAVFDALKSFQDTKGLIIDVRPNGGGSELLARKVAGCFIDKPCVYAKNVNRIPGPVLKFTEVFERVVDPSKDLPHYTGKVAVLMGEGSVSSCESFVMMMQQVPGCKLVGSHSRGSSGNPKPIDLGNGITVMLPTWKDFRLDGTCFEGEGIAPDIEVKTTQAKLRKEDAVLSRAIKFIMNDEPDDKPKKSPQKTPIKTKS
jgi:hypothetical protein